MANTPQPPQVLGYDFLKFWRNTFATYDKNNNGFLSLSEYLETNQGNEMSFAYEDKNHDRQIMFSEFVKPFVEQAAEGDQRKAQIWLKIAYYDHQVRGYVAEAVASDIVRRELSLPPRKAAQFTRNYMDGSGSMQMDYNTFVTFYSKVLDGKQELADALKAADPTGSYHVTIEKAQEAAIGLGYTEAEAKVLVQAFDWNDNLQLEYAEFVAMYQKFKKN